MGLCGFSPKATAIVAGIITLLQGLTWSVIGTLSLLVYSCSIHVPDSSSLVYRFYLVYLYKTREYSEYIQHFTRNRPYTVETDNGTSVTLAWPELGVRAAGRTYWIVIIYLVLSLLWVIAALLLIIASISDITRIRGVVFRSPWLILTSLLSIFDVITSVYYTIDISSTGDLPDLFEFVGLVVESDLISTTSTSSSFGLTSAPSILALAIFSRAIIGWILNLAFLMYVAQDVKNAESPPAPAPPEPRKPYQEYLKKLSTIGPVPDVKWDPYQRKRSDLPVVKPLEKLTPPNERKRKQSDYQQYLFYAKKPPQLNYLDDIRSEPPTPAPNALPTTTGVWRVSTPQPERRDEINWPEIQNSPESVAIPAPDYESELPTNSQQDPTFRKGNRSSAESSNRRNDEGRY